MEEKLRELERIAFQTCDEEDINNLLHYLNRNNLYSYQIHYQILKHCNLFELSEPKELEIFGKIAWTLWADAYISWVEDDYENRSHLSPGPGGKWEDVIPEDVPNEADLAAEKFIKEIEKLNKAPIEFLAYIVTDDNQIGDEEELGYYLTMEGLGHGVSWEDNYPPHNLNVPSIDFSWYNIENIENLAAE